ncbi:urease accessory protein UreE [Paenalcaligenes niemegkensis]|nr:urease accessory protein UreE [Paenalcaligenes niemegkensis]
MRIFQQRLSHDQADESQRHNVPVVTLSFADRRRSRQRLKLNTGEEVGLALEHGLVLVDGDWLADANGELIMVRAARETVLRITSGSNLQLTRAAYHLGNRHVTLEVGDGYLQLEHDPVLVDMLTQLGGLTLDQVQAAFNPDVGAYGEAIAMVMMKASMKTMRWHKRRSQQMNPNLHTAIPITTTHTITAMADTGLTTTEQATSAMFNLDMAQLGAILQLSSPALPIGGYSYSQGLEGAVEIGLIHDKHSASDWISQQLQWVVAHSEGPIWALLYDAWSSERFEDVVHWNSYFYALRETSEIRLETTQMGWSLNKLASELRWYSSERQKQLQQLQPMTLPAVHSLAAYSLNIDKTAALTAFFYTWLENQVTAAIKSVPLGQVAGQQILTTGLALLPSTVNEALARSTSAPPKVQSFAPSTLLCPPAMNINSIVYFVLKRYGYANFCPNSRLKPTHQKVASLEGRGRGPGRIRQDHLA